MLVAIAIIALLSVLLLGALRMAFSIARQTQCMSNVKQLAAGVASFSNRNKGFGPPGFPNAFDVVRPQNTLWTATPDNDVARPIPVVLDRNTMIENVNSSAPRRGPRFKNLGYLWRDADITDERTFSCPDMETSLSNGFGQQLNSTFSYVNAFKPYDNTRWNPSNYPPGSSPVPADPGVGVNSEWRGAYDFRSSVIQNPKASAAGHPLGFNPFNSLGVTIPAGAGQAPFTVATAVPSLVNLAKHGGEVAIVADTIQNPANSERLAHDNARYNVAFADGHGETFRDEGRANGFGFDNVAAMRLDGTNAGHFTAIENVWWALLSLP
jgi:prepilin-type processing-associated H-X9-DG protein